MADIISRLKLESGEFDSKIKRAGQELMAYSEHCRKTGLEMGYANRDAKEFAKALGNMQTTSSTARGKINELSDAFVNLRVMYKNMTDEEKNNTFGKNLAASLDQLKTRINAAKADLADVTAELNGAGKASGGGLFGGGKLDGMLQVFGGNLMTKAAGAIANLGSEMADMVRQGVELAKQGEGIRIAFERLGRGDILDGLREATHGTVTDLELMKAAVKFNDFKLPVEELGTMLAFAQQKAKDTGQSVDYMVDSIVTGLGRKSLMILDNLGLSASEIKERMGETGDMTKAVGEIIREQMSKAGDYVETAADRAQQANVSLQNKMEELGRKFAPIEEASNSLWTSMKIGILDIVGGPLARLLNGLTEAGRLKNMLDDVNGGGNGKESRTDRALRMLREYSGGGRGIEGKRDLYNRQVESYNKQEEGAWREANRLREELKRLRSQQKGSGLAGNLQPLINDTSQRLEAAENRARAIQIARTNYQAGAKQILSPTQPDVKVPASTTPKPTTHKATPQEQSAAKYEQAEKDYQQAVEQAALEMRAGRITQEGQRRKELQAKEVLWKAIGDAREIYDTPELKAAQKKAADEIVRLGGEVKSLSEAEQRAKDAARQLEQAQTKLAEAQKELTNAQASGDLKQIYAAEKKVETAQQAVTQQLEGVTIDVPVNYKPQDGKLQPVEIPLTTANLDAFTSRIKEELANADLGSSAALSLQEGLSDATAIGTILQTAIQNGIDTAQFDTSGLMKKLINHEDISDEDIQAYVDQLNTLLKEKFDETEWPKVLIKFNADTKSIEKMSKEQQKDAQGMSKEWQAVSNSISAVGSAMNSIKDPTAKIIGIVMSGIASVSQGAGQAIAKAGAESPTWYEYLAAAAAITAQMVTTIAQIHDVTGYANGGIVDGRGGGFVGGTAYSGDNIGNVRLDAGELVLNRSQQGNLATALEGNAFGNMELSTRLAGEDIIITINNVGERNGHGEYIEM